MNPLHVLTDSTCGEACWSAREEVCRCSCGGKNHGCLRSADGIRPPRTSKIGGLAFELTAVGTNAELSGRAMGINKAAGIAYVFAHSATKHYGYQPAALVRPASKDQIARWPELTKWREMKTSEMTYRDVFANKPYLLWTRL